MKNLVLLLGVMVVVLLAYFQFSPIEKKSISDNGLIGPPTPLPKISHQHLVDSILAFQSRNKAQKSQVKEIVEYSVSRGDTFSKILGRFHIDKRKVGILSSMIHQKLDMSLFKVGQLVSVFFNNGERVPYKLSYQIDPRKTLEIDVKDTHVTMVERDVHKVVHTIEGLISNSMVHTVKRLGAHPELADKLLSLFVWDVNFKKLKKGDSFKVRYEDLLVGEESVGIGNVIFAQLVHDGTKYEAYYFESGNTKGHFDRSGNNVSRAPLRYDLVSSLYSKRRFHPVKRRYRAHLGMDFMADEGTPVTALKEGTIVRARYGRANGNYVKIKHEDGISTQYLHLSQIAEGIKEGKYIERGTVIGEVGSTGLSSGPHLCLRLWRNGKQVDPLSYPFKRQAGVPKELLPEFEALVNSYHQETAVGMVTAP